MSVEYYELYTRSALFRSAPVGLLSLSFLVIGRILPLITLTPFFGSRILPQPVKVMFSISLLVIVLPKLLEVVTEPLPFDVTLLLLFGKELLIGTILGFFLGLPFLIVTSSGVFIDHQRGAASLMVNDPTIQNQSSPIGTLYNLLLIVLFFAMDAPFMVINALMDSFQVVPPDKFLNPLFFAPTSFIKDKITTALQIVVALALQLSAPALIAMLMTDSFLGIINRLAPQVQITFLGMGLKSWLAIFVVCIGWYVFAGQLGKQILVWMHEFLELIPALNYGYPPGPPIAPITPTPT